MKPEPEKIIDSVNEAGVHVEHGTEHVEMQDLIEEQMKCFLCDDHFGSINVMEDHLSEEHQIDREAYKVFNVKWSLNKTTAKEGKNKIKTLRSN